MVWLCLPTQRALCNGPQQTTKIVETLAPSRRACTECSCADYFGTAHCDISCRVRCASLRLWLANAPVGLWCNLAFIAHHHLRTPWFEDAMRDLEAVIPRMRPISTTAGSDIFLSANWSEAGKWVSLHSYGLPRNMSGHRYLPQEHTGDDFKRGVNYHVKFLASRP